MRRQGECCCGTTTEEGYPVLDLPEQIKTELSKRGGLPALEKSIPVRKTLEARGKIFQALSDPIRLSILYVIRDHPLCVCVINSIMHLSGSKLSYHLNILKESGLVEREYDGNWIIYSITERGRRLLQCTEHAER